MENGNTTRQNWREFCGKYTPTWIIGSVAIIGINIFLKMPLKMFVATGALLESFLVIICAFIEVHMKHNKLPTVSLVIVLLLILAEYFIWVTP